MSGSNKLHSYPEVGSPERLDAIVARGAGLRRRRRMLGATGAGMAGIACLALFFAVSGGLKTTAKQSVTADKDTVDNPAPPPPAEPKLLEVDEKNGRLLIDINDPSMAVPTDPAAVTDTSYAAQQCVTVTVTNSDGQPVAGGRDCRAIGADPTGPEPLELELRQVDGVDIGCPAVLERLTTPVELTTTAARTRFVTQLPAGLQPGTYTVEINSVSGFGDGCHQGIATDNEDSPQNLESAQVEKSAVTKRVLTVE